MIMLCIHILYQFPDTSSRSRIASPTKHAKRDRCFSQEKYSNQEARLQCLFARVGFGVYHCILYGFGVRSCFLTFLTPSLERYADAQHRSTSPFAAPSNVILSDDLYSKVPKLTPCLLP